MAATERVRKAATEAQTLARSIVKDDAGVIVIVRDKMAGGELCVRSNILDRRQLLAIMEETVRALADDANVMTVTQ